MRRPRLESGTADPAAPAWRHGQADEDEVPAVV